MKKNKAVMMIGTVMLVLSACGRFGDSEEMQINAGDSAAGISNAAEELQETREDEMADSSNGNAAESKEDVLESLTGEYGYPSDDGSGRLIIQKTSYGYDISDYESESSYRFLADSSNIETIEDGRICLKYPEQVFSDGTAVFSYCVLEYDADGIDVYYGKDSFEEVEFLYHAVKKDVSVEQQGNSAYAGGDADSETTADELLDSFISGSISAVYATDPASTFYITDLNKDAEEWNSYSVGEKVDLDNDGENELVMNGPYGGIYLDVRNNKVYEFAAAEGTALVLSYTYYNGAVWIMYSSRSSAGFEYYHMEKYEGADNLAAEMNFGEELADPDHVEAGMKYTLNDAEISYDEYNALCSKILAAEVNTN